MNGGRFLVFVFSLIGSSVLLAQTPGQISSNIPCRIDTSQKYCIYLPKGYTDIGVWPILFVFDPAARAEFAAEIFREPAEMLGYIVMVSHNSRNGPWEPILAAADAMFTEAFTHYAIDTNRIYTTGFSGGSRAAMLLALSDTRIDGVIGCGAGMPISIELPKPLSEYNFRYIGCVGTQDMNFHEMLDHHKTLDNVGLSNTLLIFRGPHQWPPEEIVREAMLYLDMEATVKGISTRSNVSSAYLATLDRARAFVKESYLVLSADILGKIIVDFEDMVEVSEAENLLDSISSLREYERQLKEIDKINRKEEALMAELEITLAEARQLGLPLKSTDVLKGADSWADQLSDFKKSAEKSDPLMADMYMRVYRSALLTFIVGAENFAEHNVEAALPYGKVWADADPENAWAQYQMAKLLVRAGEHKEALDYLERAVDLQPAFIHVEQLNKDFKALSQFQKFKDLEQALAELRG